MREAVIVSVARTPVGRAKKGSLKRHPPRGASPRRCSRRSSARTPGLEPEMVDDVILGCAMPEGEQGMNVARDRPPRRLPDRGPGHDHQPLLLLGLAGHRAGRRHASRPGSNDIVIAGGVESMSHGRRWAATSSSPSPELMDAMPDAYTAMGDHRRGRRPTVRHHPRDAGRVRRATPTGRRRRRSLRASSRTRSCRSTSARGTTASGPSSPSTPTRGRAPTPPSRAWPSSSRRSTPRAPSPPATPRRSTTARPRWWS